MREADLVLVFWDMSSKGSHFDLGMAWALDKIDQLDDFYRATF